MNSPGMPSGRIHPMIGRLSVLLVSGNRTGLSSDVISTASPSPRSPLEYKIQSPRGLKNYHDLGGGVGLGIVAALEKSSSKSLTRSDPIPVGSCKTPEKTKGGFDGMEMETESLEENYTYVTSHRPEKPYTKVYYDTGEYGNKSAFSIGIGSMPKESPCKPVVGDVSVYPTSDFLNSCHLCKKKLHGKDIYMYRGEKGFCSVECRSRQIMVDEHREQCRSEVLPRSADVSSSPYTTSPIFSTGIVAI